MKIYSSLDRFTTIKNPILTTGTFDGVHIGHQKIITQINKIAQKEKGESVLLTFFPHPRMVLFPDDDRIKLILSQKEKIERLRIAGLQHLIIYPFTKEFSRLSHVEFVRDILVNKIGVKKLVIGYDHQFGRNREGNFEELKDLAPIYDFKVEEIPAQTIDDVNISSTKIRKAIKAGDFETVTNYLGYRFHLSARVIEGNKMGREIGYRTANLSMLESYKITPGNGVYAVKVKYLENVYDGMMNIGTRPTVTGGEIRSMEVHIIKFNKDIYNEMLEIEFITRIRDEKKFNSAQELSDQLAEDKLKAINLCAQ